MELELIIKPKISQQSNTYDQSSKIIYRNIWEMFDKVIELNNHNINRPGSPLSISNNNIIYI